MQATVQAVFHSVAQNKQPDESISTSEFSEKLPGFPRLANE
jgi:hypothetical protein